MAEAKKNNSKKIKKSNSKQTSKKTKKNEEVKIKSSKKSSKASTVKPKTSKKNNSKTKLNLENKNSNHRFYDELKLSESYVSLVLGGLVVIGIFIIFFAFIKVSKNSANSQKVLNSSTSPTPTPMITIYIIKDNESLWDVAVKFYGDGFAYPRIVEANKNIITNPDYVPPGTKIVIPGVSQR